MNPIRDFSQMAARIVTKCHAQIRRVGIQKRACRSTWAILVDLILRERVYEVGDNLIEVVGVVDEHGVACFEEFDAGGGEFGLDEFGLGFELRFINIKCGLIQFGEDRSDIPETEDVEHFDGGSVGGSFQRSFLHALDVFVGLLRGVHIAHEGVGEF